MICARTNCTNEATMIHMRRQRKDGSWYVIKWCNDCQRRRINAYNQTREKKVKKLWDMHEMALASQQRILARRT